MLIESIVRFTLGIKDHRIVSVTYINNEPRITLDRVSCPEHGVKVERIPWSMGKRPISFPLITVLAFWSRLLSWDQVPGLFHVSSNTVRGAIEGSVDYGREREDYHGVRFIGIDEISRKKGHTYHTNVYDLERKRLIWSGAHRDKDSLRRFSQWWG
ncbi:MAG: transposase, partial [Deltaproteobacteria bacterium]|nr:transposase [Deltaproteobacteria bacterium]